ncbi:MATE family efflux transporter [Coprobacter sp.]
MYTKKEIWKISYPILISLVVQNLINITDTAYLGRVGEIELGASALAGVFYMAIYMIGFGFSIGSQILIGRRNGEKCYDSIGSIVLQGSLFLVALAFLLFGVSHFYAPYLMRSIISSGVVFEATMQYLDYRIYGLFFSFVAVMFRAFYVGITHTKILTVNALIMAMANIIFNYMFIFGKWGCPQMGIAGAALGSVLSEALSLLFFVVYTICKTDTSKYAFFEIRQIDVKVIGRILNISVWTMLQSFLPIITWFFFFISIEHLGERPLAISNIVRSVSTLFFMPVNAFAVTASSLVSNAIGEGNISEVIPVSRRIIGLCYMIIIPMMVLVYLFPEYVLRIYTDSSILLHDSIPALYVMLGYYFIAVPGCIWFNTMSGTGNTRSALFAELVTAVAYTLAIYFFIFYLRPDIAVCWVVEYIYWGVLLLFSFIYLKKADWQNKKI